MDDTSELNKWDQMLMDAYDKYLKEEEVVESMTCLISRMRRVGYGTNEYHELLLNTTVIEKIELGIMREKYGYYWFEKIK